MRFAFSEQVGSLRDIDERWNIDRRIGTDRDVEAGVGRFAGPVDANFGGVRVDRFEGYALAVVLKDYDSLRENRSQRGRELIELEFVFVVRIRTRLFS